MLARVDPGVADEVALGRVEVAHAEQRNLRGVDRAGVDDHPQRHAPLVAGRRAFGRVQVAVRVDPDDPEPVVPGREPLDRADVRAAAAAQDERSLGQLRGEGEDLARERVLVDDSRLRVREVGDAASAIASPPFPQARGTRTSPAPNSRPQEWHWYSGPIATAVKRLAVRALRPDATARERYGLSPSATERFS